MGGFLIAALIAGWFGYVIYRKVKDIKKGKFCSGCGGSCSGCSGCSSEHK